MTVYELKRALEDCNDDAEVRLAHQPSWPFEYDISSVVETTVDLEVITNFTEGQPTKYWVADNGEDPQDEDYWVAGPFDSYDAAVERMESLARQHQSVVYIAEGSQLGYLDGDGRKAVGW